MVRAQPLVTLSDNFVRAMMLGQMNWELLAFPSVRVIDRQDRVVASAAMTGLRVEADGSAHANPVQMENYVPSGDSLMTVEIWSQTFGRTLTIEMVPLEVTPMEPFLLQWDARGIFRP